MTTNPTTPAGTHTAADLIHGLTSADLFGYVDRPNVRRSTLSARRLG